MKLPNQAPPVIRKTNSFAVGQQITPSDPTVCAACHLACNFLPPASRHSAMQFATPQPVRNEQGGMAREEVLSPSAFTGPLHYSIGSQALRPM